MSTETRDRILSATLRGLAAHGIAGLSLEDVAHRARVSRQTVYRYFGTRDALIQAAILREEESFIADVRRAVRGHDELRPAMEAAFRTALEAAWEHPLLARLLETEPEALLPFLTTGAGPLLSAAHPVLDGLLSDRLPSADVQRLHRAADVATRLIVSYAINRPGESLDVLARSLADLLVNGLQDGSEQESENPSPRAAGDRAAGDRAV